MCKIGHRIQQLVDVFAKGKKTLFAARMGVNESSIRSYIMGVQPKSDFLEKVVLELEVSADWLLTGRGEMMAKKKDLPAPSEDQARTIESLVRMIDQREERIEQLVARISRMENAS